jgi:hypothetical protein
MVPYVSLCDVYIYGTHSENFVGGHITNPQEPDRYQVFLHFGTFTRSLLSVWEMTIGNPAPITWLLVNSVSEWFIIFFLIHLGVVGFAVITVGASSFMKPSRFHKMTLTH